MIAKRRHRLAPPLVALLCMLCGALAAEPLPAIPLWPDRPPQFLAGAPAESLDAQGTVRNVTVPSLTVFPAAKDKATGHPLIICAGGGYGSLGWRAIKADLEKLGVPVRMHELDEGAHGVGNLLPHRVANGFPPTRWPHLLLEWLAELRINHH